MLDLVRFLADFNHQGFYSFGVPKRMDDFPWFPFSYIKSGDQQYKTPDLSERMTYLTEDQQHSICWLRNLIEDELLGDLRKSMMFNDAWNGVAQNVQGFHNDFDPYSPEYTASLNVYLDESGEQTGGLLQFSQDGETVLGEVYPKKGEVIILNQTRAWLHRVTPTTQKRRMISFKLALLDLVPNIEMRNS